MHPLHKILCVEDDPDIRMILDLALSKIGSFQLCLAEDAQQALVQLENFQPDLLLLDQMLPGMTGLEFLSHIRARPGFVDVPAILLTAKLCTRAPLEYSQPGLLGVIAKPFDPLTLVSQIEVLYHGC